MNAATPVRVDTEAIPAVIEHSLYLPPPGRRPQEETYSVVVNHVPAQELLFALIREARHNIDLHPGIAGHVTLNAFDQTLPQLLERISRQIDMRLERQSGHWAIVPDTPYLKQYKVDYVNMARQVSGALATSTQIANAAPSAGAASTGGAAGSTSNTRIDNSTRYHFWESLEKNLRDLLRETDKPLPEGSSETRVEQVSNQSSSGLPPGASTAGKGKGTPALATLLPNSNTLEASSQSSGNAVVRRHTFREAASVIVNPESGVVAVRATRQQHERVAEFIEQVVHAARQQVLIEATIVEVELAEGYRQGIDWQRLRADGSGFSVTRPGSGRATDSSDSAFSLVISRLSHPLNLVATLNALETFGSTKVLSSPRLAMLNNQTALLKVVENVVYFSVKADTTTSATTGTTTAVSTTPQSVSVGLVMAVTAQISEAGMVILNVRPSISSVADWKQDPNPNNKVANFVPQIRTREMESVLRVASGDVAILGGLMEDRQDTQTGRMPVLGQIPLAGELLTRRDNASRKAELVIFLRPLVSPQFHPLSASLPDRDFFQVPAVARPAGGLRVND